ncbi:MAG: thioredoxin domain-containing protein [Patescibacteria group bacterium]
MKNYLLPASILIAAALISGSVLYTSGIGKQTASLTDTNKNGGSEVFLDVADDDIVLGEKNAPVSVIVYSDPSCPFCGAAAGGNKEVIDYLKQNDPSWTPPVPGIIKDYVNSGKAKIVFRYFPGHGLGEAATKILYCANEQGKFWQLHDVFFDNQDLMENIPALMKIAADVGIDSSKLESCLKESWPAEKLAKDTASGQALGVKGTPAFFVNGTKLEGAYSFSKFKLIIDSLLGK